MRNVTLTCPNCNKTDRAVGDPNENDNGWSGNWFCFNCKSSGTFQMEFTITTGADPVDPSAP